jgi:hypothetical protein
MEARHANMCACLEHYTLVTPNTPKPCDECHHLFFGDLLEDKKTRKVVCRLDLELGKPGCPRFDLVKQTVHKTEL